MWGDIPAKGWRIHPRPEAVAFCCRGKSFSKKSGGVIAHVWRKHEEE